MASTPPYSRRLGLVGKGRQTDRRAFLGIALRLPVQWLMLAKLLEQDHGQKTGTGPASGDHVEWRRRLADLLAIAAGELLADVLDHLPGFRDHLQCLGDVLAELRQPRTTTVGACCRSRHHQAFAGQMLRERLT